MSKAPYTISPPGVAVWPRLNEPDFKFKEEGVFTTALRFDMADPAVQGYLSELEQVFSEAYERQCQIEGKKSLKKHPLPWSEETDDEDNPTGNHLVKYSLKFRYKSKKTEEEWVRRPAIFGRDRLPSQDKIGGGSVLNIKTQVYTWYTPGLGFGITLQPVAVQIVSLVEPGGASAEGFDALDEPALVGGDGGDQAEDNDDF